MTPVSLEEVMEAKVVRPVAIVEFKDGYKKYDFLNDIDLSVGDDVVVDTAQGIQLAVVVGFKDISNTASKWVIQKVDLKNHTVRLEKEKKKKEIMTKLEVRRKAAQELEVYQILAQSDPEMATLLTELKELK